MMILYPFREKKLLLVNSNGLLSFLLAVERCSTLIGALLLGSFYTPALDKLGSVQRTEKEACARSGAALESHPNYCPTCFPSATLTRPPPFGLHFSYSIYAASSVNSWGVP